MTHFIQDSCKDVGDKKTFKRISGHKRFVESCVFSPDGVHLATCSGDETVQIWDSSETSCKAVLKGHEDNVWNVDFNKEGELLCSCSTDKTVRVWSVVDSCQKHVLRGHSDTVWACKFLTDNIRLASCSSDRSIILWDFHSERGLMKIHGHKNVVEDIALSPGEKLLLASCSRDRTIGLWSNFLCNKKKLTCKFLSGHKERITSISFLPKDGTLLASSSADKTVRIWDIGTGLQLQVLSGHSNIIWKCTLIQIEENPILASCSSDRSLRFWDPISGTELKKFINLDSSTDPIAQLFCCSFSSPINPLKMAITAYDGGVFIADFSELINEIIGAETETFN